MVYFYLKASVLAWCALIKYDGHVLNTAVAKSRALWCLLALVTFTHIQAGLIFISEKPSESCLSILRLTHQVTRAGHCALLMLARL
jgi:hypothetical protein